MIVTKTKKIIYKVEVTEQQRTNLILLLESLKKNCRDLIAIQSEHGKEVMQDVAETADDLLVSLQECKRLSKF